MTLSRCATCGRYTEQYPVHLFGENINCRAYLGSAPGDARGGAAQGWLAASKAGSWLRSRGQTFHRLSVHVQVRSIILVPSTASPVVHLLHKRPLTGRTGDFQGYQPGESSSMVKR